MTETIRVPDRFDVETKTFLLFLIVKFQRSKLNSNGYATIQKKRLSEIHHSSTPISNTSSRNLNQVSHLILLEKKIVNKIFKFIICKLDFQ